MSPDLIHLVSIIIPVYNRNELITETLNSISNQMYSHFECWIVDDGSTDGTVKKIEEYQASDKRFRLVKRPTNLMKGAPSCRNLGLSLAQGEFVQFFDSDDLMAKDCLWDKVNELSNNKDLDFTVSRTSFLLENGEIEDIDQYLIHPENFADFIRNKTMFFTPGPMFRRSFLNQFSVFFDTKLPRHQEFECYTRLMMNSPHFSILNKVHCFYRLHGESIKSMSDQKGNLFYRYYKCLAIYRMNLNSKGHKAHELYQVFKPYFITTCKVAMYHFHLFKSLQVLIMLLQVYIARLKTIE